MDECFAFSTKERAPIFLCLEVVDFSSSAIDNTLATRSSRAVSGSTPTPNAQRSESGRLTRAQSESPARDLEVGFGSPEAPAQRSVSASVAVSAVSPVVLPPTSSSPSGPMGQWGSQPPTPGDVAATSPPRRTPQRRIFFNDHVYERYVGDKRGQEQEQGQTSGLEVDSGSNEQRTEAKEQWRLWQKHGQVLNPHPHPHPHVHAFPPPHPPASKEKEKEKEKTKKEGDLEKEKGDIIKGGDESKVAPSTALPGMRTGTGVAELKQEPKPHEHEQQHEQQHDQTTSSTPPFAAADGLPQLIFKERWADKEQRIRHELLWLQQLDDSRARWGGRVGEGTEVETTTGATTAYFRRGIPLCTHLQGWRLLPVIVKSNDDLRQEQFACQLLSQMQIILAESRVRHWMRAYNIVATRASCGVIEAVPDTVSLDVLHRRDPDYTTLLGYFQRMYGGPATAGALSVSTPAVGMAETVAVAGEAVVGEIPTFSKAVHNFTLSLATYSMVSYVLAIKDRHNGNILLDTEGHVIHIDFGFMLGNTPGGNMGFEAAPFKLTAEMVELLEVDLGVGMGGVSATEGQNIVKDRGKSAQFQMFKELCVEVFMALRTGSYRLFMLAETVAYQSQSLPCFADDPTGVITDFKERFKLGWHDQAVRRHIHELIDRSADHWTTNCYDRYQKCCVGVF